MDRNDFLNFESSAGPARREASRLEWRDMKDGQFVYRGYASVTEQAYPVYGGTFPGWVETMARGSFKKTLSEHADVNFLVNHEGVALARTKSGTMKLNEDTVGLHVEARMDPTNPDVARLRSAATRGDVDEMSFGFKVVRDEWLTDDGEPADDQTGSQRRILEVNMQKGDVSAVNYGANPATSGSFRALAEIRDGRLNDDALGELVRAMVPEQRAMVTGAEMQLQRIEQAVAEIRAMFVVETATTVDGIPTAWLTDSTPNEIRIDADPDPLVAAYTSLWDMRR